MKYGFLTNSPIVASTAHKTSISIGADFKTMISILQAWVCSSPICANWHDPIIKLRA